MPLSPLLSLLLGLAALGVDGTASPGHSGSAASSAGAFKTDASALFERVRADPDFAAVSVEWEGPRARIYFKGDARNRLAAYTSDPRFVPVSAALSAAELDAVKARITQWLRSRGISWKEMHSDYRTSLVYASTLEPSRLLGAARSDGIDMRHVRILRVMLPQPEADRG